NWVNKVVFSKDSKQFLTFGEYVAKRWELANGALVGTFTGHTSWVADGGFLPNNGVYTIAFDSTIRFWSYAGKELIQTLRFDEEYPKSVLLSSDAKQLLASYNSGGVKVWNKEGNKFPNQPSFSLDGHDGIITTLAHSPDETKVVTGGGDGHLVFWNTLTDQVTVSDPLTYPINSIAFSSDNSFVVASTTGNDAIQLGLDGKIITTFKGHINSINRVALAPNNQRLYTASADSYTGIWELNTGNAISYPHKHTQQVNSITTSPDGNYVVTASDDLSVILWKSDGTFIRTLGRKDYAYTDAQFSADGQKVLGLNASYVSIWDLAGNELAILNGHKTSLTSASFSADGQKVITSSTDGTAKVWSVTGTELFTLKGHTNYVNDAVFSRNGKYVVTSSNDQTVGLWLIDTEIPQLVASLKGHSGEVIKGFYFNRDNLILTASTDGTVRIWATPLRIYNYLKTWKASGISDNDLKAFGFTEAEIKQFKQNGWI
ncbi:MAG: WD40 repeat domain-containing protein, partial [Flammeovirgaceae bacterium]